LDTKQLHIELFLEEYDKIYDSILDAKERAKGINPMSKEYQLKVAKKRKKLGVSPLSSSGDSVDDSSWKLCKKECEARKNKEKTSKTELIEKYLIEIKKNKEKIIEDHYKAVLELRNSNSDHKS
tara:strand:- start:1958 stop:2329 length:372 start_codon:yes stop_codon:yes gene_type:complete